MLNELTSFRRLCHQQISFDDITVVVALRLHERNPWVLDRLAVMRTHFDPLPPLLVVDFGSEPPFSDQIAEVCRSAGFQRIYVSDRGTFSLAMARNRGAQAAKTDFVFFADVDVFSTRGFFADLAEHANAIGAGECLDVVVNVPVYHLAEDETGEVWAAQDDGERSQRIRRAMARQVISDRRRFHYIDPSSNFFLIRRRFFDLVGGYNENFRGHGSEDFEFLLRMAHYSKQFPLPSAPLENIYSPIKEDFFGPKFYRGFRRFGELVAYQAECAGLRLCHLYHPRGTDSWYAEHDRGKSRFAKQTAPFIQDPTRLLEYDWILREKKVILLLRHRRQVDYFFPLRMAGYKIELLAVDSDAEAARASVRLGQGGYDALCVFNPYMNSHRIIRPLVEKVRQAGTRVIVVDRGLLPESWFFAPDMPYGDSTYASDSKRFAPTEQQLRIADEYRARLRSGSATLESNGDFEATFISRGKVKGHRELVLVPLQLEDDVAVTWFNEGFQPYPDFRQEVAAAAAARTDLMFFVKPHPLSKRPFESASDNVVVCGPEDNIHALIELADHTICYNSGVGFLAMLHGKPVTTIGNAFYNLPGFGSRAATFADALRRLPDESPTPDETGLRNFLAWLLFEKYAFFTGTSVIRELQDRKAHHYRDLLAYQFPMAGGTPKLRAFTEFPFGSNSYAAGRLGTAIVCSNIPDKQSQIEQPMASAKTSTATRTQAELARGSARLPALNAPAARKMRKFVRDPESFFLDALTNAERRASNDAVARKRIRKARKLIVSPNNFFRDAAANMSRKLREKG